MRLFIPLMLVCSLPLSACAQTVVEPSETVFELPETSGELRKQILEMDTIMFDKGFNECDIESTASIMLDDAVMIHDQGGVSIGKEAFLKPVRENICNGGPMKPLRKLNEHTTAVYPLYANGKLYGAIQNGEHSFYIKEGDKEPYLTNQARFTSIWWLEEEGWKLKTALSFEHKNPTENHPMDMDVLTAGFDRRDDIEFLLKMHNVESLSVATINNGALQEVRTFGQLSDDTKAPIDSIYNAASLAKPVTALVTLKLVDGGKWNLDDPVSKYFMDPDLKNHAYADLLTTRQILTHSSGLPNWRSENNNLTFEFRPGDKWQYSGEGFETLRQALEAKTGESLETLAQRHVFDPIRMTDTSYLYPLAKQVRIATRYDENGVVITHTPHTQANGAANLMTTAEDYGRFVAYLMSGAGLSDSLSQQLFDSTMKQKDGIGFGLGWSIVDNLPDGGFAFQHTGMDPGVRAIAIGMPKQGRGIVILSNSDNAPPTWQGIISEQLGAPGDEVISRNR